MDDIIKIFSIFGYSSEEAIKVINEFRIKSINIDKFCDNIFKVHKTLMKYGFNRVQTKKIIMKNPRICSIEANDLNRRLETIKRYFKDNEEFINYILYSGDILKHSSKSIKNKIDTVSKLGYKEENLLKMLCVFDMSIDDIKNRIIELVGLGFTIDEIIKMTTMYPNILSVEYNNLNEKYLLLEKYGFSISEIASIFYRFPTGLLYKAETYEDKLEFFNSIGLKKTILLYPNYLRFPTKLLYARYKYLTKKGIVIDEKNYSVLFLTEADFYKRFLITKSELLIKYDYSISKSNDDLNKIYIEKKRKLISMFVMLGYKLDEYKVILKTNPVYSYNIDKFMEDVLRKYKYLSLYGFNKLGIISITTRFPGLYSVDLEAIKDKLKRIQGFGYEVLEVIDIVIAEPHILDDKKDIFNDTIRCLITSGYTKQEALDITIKFNKIFSIDSEEMLEKLEFYNSLGMHNQLISHIFVLNRSLELSVARYKYLQDNGIDYTNSNYMDMLVSDEVFSIKYNITSEELLSKYRDVKVKVKK